MAADSALDGLLVEPVFTAHPTEAVRRTILRKEQRIARVLVERFHQGTMTPEEIATEASQWLSEPQRLQGMQDDLRSLRGQPGAVAALSSLVEELLPSVGPNH